MVSRLQNNVVDFCSCSDALAVKKKTGGTMPVRRTKGTGKGAMLGDTDRQDSEDLAPNGEISIQNPLTNMESDSIEDSRKPRQSAATNDRTLKRQESEDLVEDQSILANKEEMTEDEVQDLMFAFQAADVDGGGSIDADEFGMMLNVLGCNLNMDEVHTIIKDAKSGFATWLKIANKEHVQKCQNIWDEYDADNSNTLDLEEVNNVIKKLISMGYERNLFTAADMDHFGGEMDFDQFTAWFLRQEELMADMDLSHLDTDGSLRPTQKKKKSLAMRGLEKALIPFQVGKRVTLGPARLLEKSATMLVASKGMPDGIEYDGEGFDAGSVIQNLLQEDNELIFAEYVFMMRSGTLRAHLSDDWQQMAQVMKKLREAFDFADVDSNNELELEELEMCIRSMHPNSKVEHDDVVRVWGVLNPQNKPWISYSEFVQGMIETRKNKELAELVPMDVPNRFMLLSLLIDTPINEEQEKFILDKLGRAEQLGIR